MAARIPREKLTRLLRDIAREVSAGDSYVANCSYFFGKKHAVEFRVTGLWAFGSWARGATECGDLDLLVTVEHTGEWPPTDEGVAVAVRRRRRHLDILLGPPERPGLVAEDATLIWSPDAPDWEAAIAGVAVNADAGHHPRPWDALEVKLARLRAHLDVVETLMERVEEGSLDVEWRPVVGSLRSLTTDEIGRLWEFGKSSTRVLPIALDEAMALGVDTHQLRRRGRSQVLEGGGIQLGVGGWSQLRLAALDELGCHALVVVPAWKGHGPNGALHVRRGPKHPLVKAFADVVMWTVGNGLVNAAGLSGRSAMVLELYATKDEAGEVAGDWGTPVEQRGARLLRLVDGADAVEVAGQGVPLTWEGAAYLQDVGWEAILVGPGTSRRLVQLIAPG